MELKELELSHQDMVKNLQLEYDKRITELHEQMQLQAKVRLVPRDRGRSTATPAGDA